MKFEKVRGKKGWFRESKRHALAAKGIKTKQGFKPPTRKFLSSLSKLEEERKLREQEEIESIKRNPLPVIKNAVKVAIHFAPLGREIFLCYSAAKVLYSSWGTIYQGYQTSDTEALKKGAYDFVRAGVKTGLTTHQTDYIWNKIENKVPEDIKYESRRLLFEVMSNVSEEEISLVENALGYF